jgi:hypothetical protein
MEDLEVGDLDTVPGSETEEARREADMVAHPRPGQGDEGQEVVVRSHMSWYAPVCQTADLQHQKTGKEGAATGVAVEVPMLGVFHT